VVREPVPAARRPREWDGANCSGRDWRCALKFGMKIFSYMNRFWGWRAMAVDEVKLKPTEQEIEVRVSFAETTWAVRSVSSG